MTGRYMDFLVISAAGYKRETVQPLFSHLPEIKCCLKHNKPIGTAPIRMIRSKYTIIVLMDL